jgi:hypothetical protein
MNRKSLVICVLALFATMAFARGGRSDHGRGSRGDHWGGGRRSHWDVGFSGFYWDWYVPPVYVPEVEYVPPVQYAVPAEYVPSQQYTVPVPSPTYVPSPSAPYSAAPNSGSVASEHSGIYVDYSGNDMVGSNFANSVVAQVRTTTGLVLAQTPDEAVLEISISSTDADASHPGAASALSVSYLWLPERDLAESQVLMVDTLQVGAKAASVVSYASHLLQ